MTKIVVGSYRDFLGYNLSNFQKNLPNATYSNIAREKDLRGTYYDYYILLNTDHIDRRELSEIMHYLTVRGATRL